MDITQVTLWCEIASYTQTKDRGFKIVLETGELREDQFAWLPKLYKKPLWVTMGLNPIESFEQIEDQLADAIQQWPKKKTPSERLRAVLYRYWEQFEKKNYEKFDDYYEVAMEKMISKIKDKLQ